MVAMVLEGLMK